MGLTFILIAVASEVILVRSDNSSGMALDSTVGAMRFIGSLFLRVRPTSHQRYNLPRHTVCKGAIPNSELHVFEQVTMKSPVIRAVHDPSPCIPLVYTRI